jgi:chemotaxis protein CheD
MIDVGIGEMGLSKINGEQISTHALGSCIAVIAMDLKASVAGLLHFQLPYPIGNLNNPLRFGNTGIPIFLNQVFELGAQKKDLRLHLVGASSKISSGDLYNIAKKNLELARRLLNKNNIPFMDDHVGGELPRTVHLQVGRQEWEISEANPKGFNKRVLI